MKHVTLTMATVLALASWGACAEDNMNSQSRGGNQISGQMQDLSRQQSIAFSRLDTNNDGYISKDEAKPQPQLSDQFASTDKDNNQKLDKAEFARFTTEESVQGAEPGKSNGQGGSSQQPSSSP